MNKREIKKKITEIFKSIDVLIGNRILEKKQMNWYKYFKSLESRMDESDVTKEDLTSLLKNLRVWGISSILYNPTSNYYLNIN